MNIKALRLVEMLCTVRSAACYWRNGEGEAVVLRSESGSISARVWWERSDESGDHFRVLWNGDGHPMDRMYRYATASETAREVWQRFAITSEMHMYYTQEVTQ